MTVKDKIPERESKLMNDKLDYLIDKDEYTNETLGALANILLDPPPTSTPEAPSKENESEAQDENESESLEAVDPGAIKPCLFKYVYIWPRRGKSFWTWLTFVGRKSAAGFKWNGNRWVYFGIDLREIDSFECY